MYINRKSKTNKVNHSITAFVKLCSLPNLDKTMTSYKKSEMKRNIFILKLCQLSNVLEE